MFDDEVKLTFVESGFFKGGQAPTLQNYGEETNKIFLSISELHDFWNQTLFGTEQFRLDKKPRNSYVILCTNMNGDAKWWAGKVFLLNKLKLSTCGVQKEMVFRQYM